jgi:hypothetical protein
MPRISEFFGIVIAMYFDDHAPPHFHAINAEHEATFGLDTLRPGRLLAAPRGRARPGVGRRSQAGADVELGAVPCGKASRPHPAAGVE